MADPLELTPAELALLYGSSARGYAPKSDIKEPPQAPAGAGAVSQPADTSGQHHPDEGSNDVP